MKKTVLVFFVLVFAVSLSFAISFSKLDWQFYVGAALQQSKIDGLKDARLSDYKWYGTSEGSLFLPLADSNGSRLLIGGVVGARTRLLEHLAVLTEVEATFGKAKTFAINVNAGALYYFVDSSIHVGAGAKVGFYTVNVSLGSARILPGTTPPVILPQGTIKTGDALAFSIMGININPFVDINYDINGAFSIGASVGYQFGFSFKSSLLANKISIDPATTDAYYDPNAKGFVKLSMDPKASLNGVTAQIYVTYKM